MIKLPVHRKNVKKKKTRQRNGYIEFFILAIVIFGVILVGGLGISNVKSPIESVPTISVTSPSSLSFGNPSPSSGGSLPSSGPVPTSIVSNNSPPAGYSKLIFDDEFNGSSLDLTKWKPQEDWYSGPASGVSQPVNSLETAAYDPAENSLSNGTLKQTLIQNPVTVNGKTYNYRTGFITSINFSFTYGYMEARIYVPAASNGQIANWPAWWASGPNWPTNGEIDILEGLGGCAAWHFHSPQINPGACASGNFTGWHIFAADWKPSAITFYYDGIQIGSTTTTGSGIVSHPVMSLIVGNQGGQSTLGGPLLAPSVMQIDYIRVWQ